MTAPSAAPVIDAIDAALAGAVPRLSADEQRLAVTVLRLLAAGTPVSTRAAASAAGMAGPRAEDTLRSWPEVFWNDNGQVTGFWGLALDAMPHRIRHAGTGLFA